MTAAPDQRPGRATVAILLALAAMFTFAVMDGLTKVLSQTLPIPQILWVRNVVFTCLAVAMLRRQSKGGSIWTLARSQRPLLQTFRAVLLVIESGTMVSCSPCCTTLRMKSS